MVSIPMIELRNELPGVRVAAATAIGLGIRATDQRMEQELASVLRELQAAPPKDLSGARRAFSRLPDPPPTLCEQWTSQAREGRGLGPGNSALVTVRMYSVMFQLEMSIVDLRRVEEPIVLRMGDDGLAAAIDTEGPLASPFAAFESRQPAPATSEILLFVWSAAGGPALMQAARATVDKLTMFCGGIPKDLVTV
jgi:hypothetical protein